MDIAERNAPDRVAVEQLRMLLANAPFSFILGGVANMLVGGLYALSAPSWTLLTWVAVSWLPVPVLYRVAHRFAQASAPLREVRRFTRYVTIVCTVTGMLRGLLAWIAFDHDTPLAIALLICYMVAMQAGSMAFMSPVVPAFVGYTVAFLVVLVLKLTTLHDPVYWAITGGSVLFGVAVIASARRLSKTFRTMVELRFANVELIERLSRQSEVSNAARLDAETARNEAENANLAKSRFLAAASHDLRQPIHAQGLFLEVLARSELSAYQRNVLMHARAACDASGEMLCTLLDFSRLEAGVVAVNARPFHLLPLLTRIEKELAPLADSKGIVYRIHEADVAIHSDPALVELILRNLISNAIRYTEQGGVLIGCRRRANEMRVEVWDTGIGIAAEHLGDIFNEFHQLGNPERDRHKGLGLGLAIARRLADTLAHPLSVRSRLGRGSVFALSLPIVDVPANWPEPMPRADLGIGALSVRVLVIDDDETVRAGMQYLLCSWGAQCEVAETIEQALSIAASFDPELVICDYRLREQRTGTEAIAALRESAPRLPAILITGDTAPDRLQEAQRSGFPLLHKPVLPAALYRQMTEVLALQA